MHSDISGHWTTETTIDLFFLMVTRHLSLKEDRFRSGASRKTTFEQHTLTFCTAGQHRQGNILTQPHHSSCVGVPFDCTLGKNKGRNAAHPPTPSQPAALGAVEKQSFHFRVSVLLQICGIMTLMKRLIFIQLSFAQPPL